MNKDQHKLILEIYVQKHFSRYIESWLFFKRLLLNKKRNLNNFRRQCDSIVFLTFVTNLGLCPVYEI